VASENDIDRAIAAIGAGQPVLLATDTVYGLVTAAREEDTMRLYRLKGRHDSRPTALLAASVEVLLECVPELAGRGGMIARTLLPGPYTLILRNPARRYRWLTGGRADAIGIRVATLPAPAARVLEAVGSVTATSANDPGGPSPATLADVPPRLRSACAAEIDAGRLAGIPSTVIDFTDEDPRVIRDGAAPAAEAIARVRQALAA
jgi:L-threonylcarbamoyladenylate synthase